MHHSSFLTPNTLLLLALLALTACSDDVVGVGEKSEWDKTPIEVAVGMQEEVTRAVITDGTEKTLQAMPEGTRVWTAMQSDFNTTTQSEPWSYQGSVKDTKYCVTYGTTNDNVIDDEKREIAFGTNTRYWDDAHARSSQLSLWGLAVPKKTLTKGNWDGVWTWNQPDGEATAAVTPTAWSTSDTDRPTQIVWTVSQDQNEASMAKEDLCFSNNLADYSTAETTDDRRLRYNPSDKKFDAVTYNGKGNMIFYHALTKFTIQIKCGDGYKTDGTEFKFTQSPTGKDNSFALKGFYGKGTFDVQTGEFTSSSLAPSDISSIYLANTTPQYKTAGAYHTLEAFVLPGTDMTTSTETEAFTFHLDNNRYVISMASLYAAIKNKQDAEDAWVNSDDNGTSVKSSVLGGGKTLLAGVNYEFTFIVEKTKISGITAQVVAWEDVEAAPQTPSNARITLQLEERGTSLTEGIEIYRAADPDNSDISDTYEGYSWFTGYATDGKAEATHAGDKWTTTWYWPDNATFYHFRAIAPVTPVTEPATVRITTEEGKDHIALASDVTAGDGYTDYLWGAPFLDDGNNETAGTFKWSYDPETNGFDGKAGSIQPNATVGHQIYHGIGPTTDVIKLLMFHLMSEVKIKVQTTEGADKVSLSETVDGVEKKTTLHFEHLYTQGKAAMGNGLVTTTGTAESTTDGLTMSSTDNVWIYGAIPQPLDDLILVITTPDNNRYEVTMKEVLTKTISNTNLINPYTVFEKKDGVDYYKIDRWYPDYKYEYTFTLKKTGIEKIQATILDWEEVVADETDVTIK